MVYETMCVGSNPTGQTFKPEERLYMTAEFYMMVLQTVTTFGILGYAVVSEIKRQLS